MKVLLACAAFQPRGLGGGPEASYLIAKSLIDVGLDVRVVTVGEHDAIEDYRGIQVHVVKSPNIYWNYLRTERGAVAKAVWHVLEAFNPRAYVRMRRQLRAFRPDAIVTVSIENINVATWLLAKMHGVPVVHVLHSYFLMCWRGSLLRNNRKCVTRCADCTCISAPKKLMSRLVDGVLGESRYVLDEHLKRGYFTDALHDIIPSGVAPIAEVVVKRRDGPLVVGCIAVLAPHKGVDTLGRAAASLAGSNIRYVIAGTGTAEYTEHVRRSFGGADVDFLGWAEAGRILKDFDVLVVPSRWGEPFARIVVEALAQGVPVVSSDSGGAHESFVDRVSGRVFRTDDVAMLADQLRELEQDEDRRYAIGRAAVVAARRFRLPIVGGEMQAFIERVVRRKGAPLPQGPIGVAASDRSDA